MNVLTDLQNWYAANCDGDWEHQYGVVIDTLDNPGWLLRIDLKGTELEERSFTSTSGELSDNDWFTCL